MIRHQWIYKSQRRGVGTLGMLLLNSMFLLAFWGEGDPSGKYIECNYQEPRNSMGKRVVFSTNGAGITDHPM